MTEILALILSILLGVGAIPLSEPKTDPGLTPMLLSVYGNVAWGDTGYALILYDNGRMVFFDLSGMRPQQRDPESVLLQCHASSKMYEDRGTLYLEDITEIQSAIKSIQQNELRSGWLGACDAGELWQYALKKMPEGSTQWIPLSVSGDEVAENFDPNAQFLSAKLHELMPTDKYLPIDLQPQVMWPTFFSYEYGSSEGAAHSYRLEKQGDTVRFTSKEIDLGLSPLVMGQLQKIIMDHGINAWDGFNERDENVFDGYEFKLSLKRDTDAYKTCNATGYMKYPENYDAAHKALTQFFEQISSIPSYE